MFLVFYNFKNIKNSFLIIEKKQKGFEILIAKYLYFWHTKLHHKHVIKNIHNNFFLTLYYLILIATISITTELYVMTLKHKHISPAYNINFLA